jgi:hypothetical protein
MGKEGKYIYGIMGRSLISSAGANGIEASSIANQGISTVSFQDIAAVISSSEIMGLMHMRKEVLAKLLVKHQEVIEKIMAFGHSIIPMRLGTYARDETDVKDILSKGYSLIKDIIKKISEKIEIDVAVTWSDFSGILKEIGEDEEIKKCKSNLLAKPNGLTTDEKIKIGSMLKKSLEEKRGRLALEIQTSLSKASVDSKEHELMDDRMVANFAFLINKTQQGEFDRKVEDLNATFAERLNFRCVGPLPPYSFYTLEIKRIEFKDLCRATKKLGLNYAANKDEIKKAYQRSAFLKHPDKNPAMPGMEKEFNEINEAYKVLINYCEACKLTGKTGEYFFDEEEYKKNAVLIKLRE